MKRVLSAAAALAVAALMTASPALGQTTSGLDVTTPYPGVKIEPGKHATFDLTVTGTTGRRADLQVTGVPSGWTAVLKGGGLVVNAVTLGTSTSPTLVTLDVGVATDAPDGTTHLQVRAQSGGESVTLPIDITVAKVAGGSVTMTPRFSDLRGSTGSTFNFDVTVTNDTAQDLQLSLAATGPDGWSVSAQPSGEAQASSVSVPTGGTSLVTVTAKPPVNAVAGTYTMNLAATGQGESLSTDLTVELTGTTSITLGTQNQALNATVTAGKSSSFGLVVTNTGTAPLQDVQLSATAPSGWKVTFQPNAVPQLAPGASTQVTALIDAAPDAIAGDYRITFDATVAQAQDSIEVRTTVSPSQIWGLVGIGVIALTLAALAWVFRRFGRR